MKIKSTLSLLFLIAFGATQMFGQDDPNTLTITGPASIAGEYTVNTAAWGNPITDATTATLQLLNDNDDSDSNPADDPGGSFGDACNGTINPLNGNWALMDRGDCGFTFKALAAQNAGAIGVIICNWEVGNPANEMGGGPEEPDVTIFAASMSKADCDVLKMAITETELGMGSFSYVMPVVEPCEMDVVYPPETVWGQNKEGEFENGLGEWVVEGITSPDHIWEHSINEFSGNGWETLVPLTSESICNGAAVFDYVKYNETQTSGTAFASEGTLTSPSIDLSAGDFPIVRFTQANLPLNSSSVTGGGGAAGSNLSYSIDDGATWSDPVAIETQNVWTSVTQDIFGVEEVEIPIPGAANQTNVKLRFTANGDFYYWMIDDVSIVSIEKTEIRANTNFSAGAQNFRTPVSQVEDLVYLLDIENTGNATVSNVNLDVTVRDGIVTLDEASQAYGDIAGGFIDENKAFGSFQVPAVVSDGYSITYEVTADNDLDDTNNTATKTFEVTEMTYAKVLPPAEGGSVGGISVPNQPFQSYGVAYHVPNGDGYYVKDVRFGLGNDGATPYTGIINFAMYEWLDLNEDGASQGNERLLIGFRDLPVSSSLGEDYTDISMNLAAADGSDFIALGNDKQYLIMAHVNPFNPATDPVYSAMATGDDDSDFNYHYAAMNLARDTLGLSPRYASFGGTGDDGNDVDARELTPFYNFSMYMPMEIGDIASLGVDDLNQDVKLSIYPNPAVDQLFLDISLEGVSEKISVEMIGMNGQIAHRANFSNIQTDKIEVNTSDLTPGLYIMNVRTDFGINTQKVVIEK